jgi:predicted dehydrogenase
METIPLRIVLPSPIPKPPMHSRRRFLTATASTAATLAAPRIWSQAAPPSGRLRVGVMGLGRGLAHVQAWLQVPNVEIVALCDVDRRRLDGGLAAVEKGGQKTAPQTGLDFRRFLEGDKIDVLSVAACNFWHTPAALLAAQAGKHVYVEKPGSHTAHESLLLAAASKKHGRHIQQGTQRRSLPAMREAIQRLKEGAIGKVAIARCFYDSERGSIGRGKVTPPPDWLDWTLWQGPTAEHPYKDNLVHYNWHWLWHYGGGELANNGVHGLDLALWGLNEAHGSVLTPRRVTCTGGRYHYQDDQETPDTTLLSADYGACSVLWDGSSCHKRNGGENHAFVTFYGTGGTLSLSSTGYTLYDKGGKQTAKNEPPFTDVPHFQNLADAIRNGTPLNCPAEEGQRGALLCHLGNIAYRTGGVVDYDAGKQQLKNPSKEAAALWSKEYRQGWEPKA